MLSPKKREKQNFKKKAEYGMKQDQVRYIGTAYQLSRNDETQRSDQTRIRSRDNESLLGNRLKEETK